MYVEIHEDSEHRATMRAGCAVDLFTSSQGFFTQIAHQPLGLIDPSTTLQALGASKCIQLSHCWSPFGLSWYWTDVWGAFAEYAFLLTGIRAIPASAAMLLSADRRVILDMSFMVFLF